MTLLESALRLGCTSARFDDGRVVKTRNHMAHTHRNVLRRPCLVSRSSWSWFTCAIFALAGVHTVSAREYVVDMNAGNASDEGPGTPQLPLKALAKGAQLARAGDTRRRRKVRDPLNGESS